MRLIIDIPEKVVTAIQNGKDYRYDIHTAIAQGIPYEDKPQSEFTDLEKEVTADAINYLLGAELLEENGYTEEVINALKSVLQKIGAEEDHL